MAMTLRLTDQEDAALTRVAELEGISKQEAARQAVRRYTDEREQFAKIVSEGIERYGSVLGRLA
jgi:predicted transcriptional regulator